MALGDGRCANCELLVVVLTLEILTSVCEVLLICPRREWKFWGHSFVLSQVIELVTWLLNKLENTMCLGIVDNNRQLY
ncbi:hypothetical protein GGR58DRAFT_493217 [Xylaria digitata]|nr:hypothetical protein GGR58DRAFT_493217 [Xylaria digitata]